VKRGKSVEKGGEVVGHVLYLKVAKNKFAPPFRTAEETLIYGKGVPVAWSVYNAAVACGVIVKKGSWLSYKGETLAQGDASCVAYMEKNPELIEEIRNAISEKLGANISSEPNSSESGPIVLDADGEETADEFFASSGETEMELETDEDPEDPDPEDM